MLIQKSSTKSLRFLKKVDAESEYSDSKSTGFIVDHKWNVVISHYDGDKFHVSISTRTGRTLPSLATITYISKLGLFPFRLRYMLYTAGTGTNTVHFDITEKAGDKYAIELQN